MDNKKPFYSLLNRPDTQPVEPGSEIYEWEYLDNVGNLKKDKKNIYEEIQSYKDSVDYKKLIQLNSEGEIANGRDFLQSSGVFCDIADVPSDFGGLSDYMQRLGDIVDNFRSQAKIQNAKEFGKNEQIVGQVGETAKQSVSVEQQQQGQQQGGNN